MMSIRRYAYGTVSIFSVFRGLPKIIIVWQRVNEPTNQLYAPLSKNKYEALPRRLESTV